MGKKQAKEKKFNRNVEISAPILDPEIIKAIHSPPKFGGLDMKHGGFKALLADLHSQDSTEDVKPVCEQHVPSYIGISCALSGYANYSLYNKAGSQLSSDLSNDRRTARATTKAPMNRLRTTSPSYKNDVQINHIRIDRENLQSPEEERKEFTDKLTASVADRRRSPSPCIQATVDDRHHGAYVGARYCPLPPPSQEVIKHIPLLGIDDDKDPDEAMQEQAKTKGVENKIASIYGEEFVDDWKENMSHKAKKEVLQDADYDKQGAAPVRPKDLVTLKPTPVKEPEHDLVIEIETPNIKVMENIDKPFLAKILTDDKPIFPRESPTKEAKVRATDTNPLPQNPESTGSVRPRLPDDVLVRVKRQDSQPQAELPQQSSLPIREVEEEVLRNQLKNDQIELQDNRNLSPQSESPDSQIRENASNIEQEKEEVTVREQSTPSAPPQQEDNNQKLGEKYLQLMKEEIANIKVKIEQAESFLQDKSLLNEDASGMIMSAIGKANLLINDKCNQFRQLCDANMHQNGNEQYATLNDDLAGFWDMLLLQINEVNKSFDALFKASENNWQQSEGDDAVEEASKSIDAGSKLPSSLKPKLSEQKDSERRKKLQEHINQMKAAASSAPQPQLLDEAEMLLQGLTREQSQKVSEELDQHQQQTPPQSPELPQSPVEIQPEAGEDQLLSFVQTTDDAPTEVTGGEPQSQEQASAETTTQEQGTSDFGPEHANLMD